jgi:spermidine synthase
MEENTLNPDLSQAVAPVRGSDGATRALLWVVFACFFLSGATGLIYEVLWARMLGLVFGNTVYAITTTVCAFMAGLALGGYVFGRWIDRKLFPLLAYAMLEMLVGFSVLAVPLLLKLSTILYASLYPNIEKSLWLLNTYRFLAAFLTLLIPTFFMGGTLPVLSRFFVRTAEEISRKIGWLYALNTLGATAGTILAGFFLISSLGIRRSQWLAVAVNFVIGLVALSAHKRWEAARESGSEESAAVKDPHAAGNITSAQARLVFLAFALSGFVSLLYEIAWTRALTMVVGSSVYAFSLILSVYLVGIALGSLLFSKVVGARPIRISLFGWVELLIALFAFLTVPLYLKSFNLMLMLRRAFPDDFGAVVFVQLVVCFLILIFPALLFGSTLPLAAKLCTDKIGGLGRSIGNLYAANTVGCILGSFLCGFVLLPWLTARRTILLGVLINLAIAIMIFYRDADQHRRFRLSACAVLAVVVVVVFAGNTFYDPYLQNAGVFIYTNTLSRSGGVPLENRLHTTDIVFYRESLNANIAVDVGENYVGLRTNGKTDASNGVDMVTQLMLGYLPGLFHPNPQSALVVGFGSGTSVASVAQLPSIRSVKVVEIEKAVMEAAPYFEEINHRIDRDPRLQVIIDDARNYLLNSKDRFDLILSEPSNPWIAGIGNLFSQEFYQSAASHLNPNGIMCQWVQIYELDPEILRMVIRTFGNSFRHMSLWQGASGDMLLLGSQTPMVFDMGRLQQLMDSNPRLRRDFSDYLHIQQSAGILSYFFLPDGPLRAFSRTAPLNTDDLPLLEFRAPKVMFAGTVELNRNLLGELRRSLLPEQVTGFQPSRDVPAMAGTLLGQNNPAAAGNLLRNPDPNMAPAGQSTASSVHGETPALNYDSPEADLVRARLAEAEKQYADAEQLYRRALERSPRNPKILEDLGVYLCTQGRFSEALTQLQAAIGSNPNSLRGLQFLAMVEVNLGQYDDALRHTQLFVGLSPHRSLKCQAYANLGWLCVKKKNVKEAEDWFNRSIALDRYSFAAHKQLADLYWEQKRKTDAIREYEFLVKYFPRNSETAFINLSKLYAEGGRFKEGRKLLELGRSVFPNNADIYYNYGVLSAHGNN